MAKRVAKAKSPAIKKSVMNKLVKAIAAKQNGKDKLNSGHIREVLSNFVEVLYEWKDQDSLGAIDSIIEATMRESGLL